jgi:hypothetical protein
MKEFKYVWTEFENTHLDNLSKKWVTESNYYLGDWSDVDLNEHWQTKEVPNKKKELIPIALVYTNESPLDFKPKTSILKKINL